MPDPDPLTQAQEEYNEAVESYNSLCTQIDDFTRQKELLEGYLDFLEGYLSDIRRDVTDTFEDSVNIVNDGNNSGQIVEELVCELTVPDMSSRLNVLFSDYEETLERMIDQVDECIGELSADIFRYRMDRDAAERTMTSTSRRLREVERTQAVLERSPSNLINSVQRFLGS